MTEERTVAIQQQIADMIGEDNDKAKEIFSLTPDALAAKLDGVTADEIKELGDSIKSALAQASQDELSADDLDSAAGGARDLAYAAAVLTNLAFMDAAQSRNVILNRGIPAPVVRATYVAQVRRNTSLLVW